MDNGASNKISFTLKKLLVTFVRKPSKQNHCWLFTKDYFHSGGKLYKYNVCEKVFNKKGNLTQDILVYSGKKNQCHICWKFFAHKSYLKPYLLTQKKIVSNVMNVTELLLKKVMWTTYVSLYWIKDFQCKVYEKKFAKTFQKFVY